MHGGKESDLQTNDANTDGMEPSQDAMGVDASNGEAEMMDAHLDAMLAEMMGLPIDTEQDDVENAIDGDGVGHSNVDGHEVGDGVAPHVDAETQSAPPDERDEFILRVLDTITEYAERMCKPIAEAMRQTTDGQGKTFHDKDISLIETSIGDIVLVRWEIAINFTSNRVSIDERGGIVFNIPCKLAKKTFNGCKILITNTGGNMMQRRKGDRTKIPQWVLDLREYQINQHAGPFGSDCRHKCIFCQAIVLETDAPVRFAKTVDDFYACCKRTCRWHLECALHYQHYVASFIGFVFVCPVCQCSER